MNTPTSFDRMCTYFIPPIALCFDLQEHEFLAQQHVDCEQYHKQLVEKHREEMAKKEIHFLAVKHEYIRSKYDVLLSMKFLIYGIWFMPK